MECAIVKPTKILNKFINGTNSSTVDGVVLGVEVIVDDGWDQNVNHLSQIVLQQSDDPGQGLESVQIDFAVGLLESCLEGIKYLPK